MSGEWTKKRAESARKAASVISEKDFMGGALFTAALDEIERLQACLDAEPVRVVPKDAVVIPDVVARRWHSCNFEATCSKRNRADGKVEHFCFVTLADNRGGAGGLPFRAEAEGATKQHAVDKLAAALTGYRAAE